MIILGVDPGSIVCGYGVIEKNKNKLTLVEYGVIQAKKQHEDLHLRLKEIYLRLAEVIKRTKPDEAAFETMFYAKNVQSLIKLTHARSAAILAAVMSDIIIAEYSPREVKKSVTGKGAASKEQVQFMVMNMLKIKETPHLFDATDALAVAMCHSFKRDLPTSTSKNWEDFLKKNPDRIVKV
jgi:crossover junction endodeoxyribonuclease RuvC